jgi:probable F420-dependent oxidoreductase
MKIGINILNFGSGTTPETMKQWAIFAETAGFHLVMISDHVAITPDVQDGFPAPFYDPFISIGWLAAITSKVELGTTVTILPYRHPLLTARMAANLDQISNGRFILGVGVGWAKQEFEALNVPFARRGAITSEYLEAIKHCWSNDFATYNGQFISFKNVQTGPQPVRSTGLPVWVGGSSPAAIRRAARYGDAWHPYRFSLEWLREQALPMLRKFADIEARPVPAFCPRLGLRLSKTSLPDGTRAMGSGSIAQVHSDLNALSSLGAGYILLDIYSGDPEQTKHPEKDREMLSALAEEALDLQNQSVR